MTTKRKNTLLLLGFMLFLWLSYAMSFKKSFELKKEVKLLKKEQVLYGNVEARIHRLSDENRYYDSILNIKKISLSHSFQNNLLERISSYAQQDGLVIKKFNSPHQFEFDKSKINTFVFTASGSFKKLLTLVYNLEQEYRLGKIISVDFKKNKARRTRKPYLEATVYLQQVETN